MILFTQIKGKPNQKKLIEKCTSIVWLMGPNDECYNMKNADEYIDGILRITENNGEQFGIFTSSYEDQEIMTNFLRTLAA